MRDSGSLPCAISATSFRLASRSVTTLRIDVTGIDWVAARMQSRCASTMFGGISRLA